MDSGLARPESCCFRLLMALPFARRNYMGYRNMKMCVDNTLGGLEYTWMHALEQILDR